MSTSATPSGAPAVRARSIDLGEVGDERAVVERPGQRVAAGRLDELRGLPGEPGLGGPEDEEQERGGDQPGAQRDEDDVPPDVGEAGEDGRGVAPHDDDAADLAAGLDRQLLADDRLGRERRGAGRGGRLGDRDDRRLGVALGGGRERRVGGGGSSAGARLAGRDDRAIRPADLDAEQLTRARERRELLLERLHPIGRWRGGVEVGRPGVGVDEGPGRGRVAADDVVQHRRREMGGHHDRLRGRGDPDESQERAVDEHEQERAAEARRRSEHGQRYPFPLAGRLTLGETGQRPHGPNVASRCPDRSSDRGHESWAGDARTKSRGRVRKRYAAVDTFLQGRWWIACPAATLASP